ncbi:MAG: ABC transporter ATP-binding protein/permease [Oscillospiraceae bacterium]|nr:ABC transporter ATP-binding protein/permease [Oscillospiraceae bacterium]
MNKKNFKKISPYLKPYRHFAYLSFICAFISSAAALIIPIFCGHAIDFMLGAGKVDFSGVLKYIYYIAAATVIAAIAQQLMAVSNNKIAFCISRDLRRDLFEKLQRLPLSYLDTHRSGDLLSRMITDVDTFSDGMLMGLSQLFTGIITIVGTLAVMFSYNISITLIVGALTPLSLFSARFISKKIQRWFTAQAKLRGEQTAMINELTDGMKVIHAYMHQEETLKEFDKLNEKFKKAAFRATFFSSLTNPSTRLINNIIYAAVSLVSAIFAVGGGITVGQLSVFLSYAGQYAKPFNEISGVITELQNAAASLERVFELLEETEEKRDLPNAKVLKDTGAVRFDDVSFSYTKERPLLKNISIDVKKGQKIAIVGPTGCGKTTLINLLMRFYDVCGGKITVGGEDIRNLTRKSLRKSFGMVLQDTWLKSGTIRENIAYGKLDATYEEIEAAAKSAYAHSFIKRLPNGYDTIIGEAGAELSSGQKQLLCIARVMLCLPPMLILDEATSSIDTRTEIKIQAAFAKMMQGRTSFIVAHRLSTIREADVILVMKDGNIIEQGTHKELLEKNGFYAMLYNIRAKEESGK